MENKHRKPSKQGIQGQFNALFQASLFTAILLIFLLSGCDSKTGIISDDLHSGEEGIVLEFARDMPPDDITDKMSFPIGLQIWNLGANDVENAYLALINYYPQHMVIRDENQAVVFDLEGKSTYNQEGGFDLLTYNVVNEGLPIRQRKEENFLFKAFACYKYKTEASADVCIKPRNFGFSFGGKNCDVEPIDVSGGQGAPIAVTKIEQSVLANTEQGRAGTVYQGVYKILIENVGGGTLIDPQYYDKECLQEPYKKEGNLNIIKDYNIQVRMTGRVLTCTPIERIENTDSYFTVCSVDLGELTDTYTTPLTVTIDYGYISQPVEKTVFVKRLSEAPVCPSAKCKTVEFGVCELFGGENIDATPSCPLNQKCCFEEIERCSREFGSSGYSCMEQSACNPVSVIPGFCPGEGSLVCCKPNS